MNMRRRKPTDTKGRQAAHAGSLDKEALANAAVDGAPVPVPLRLMAMRPGTVGAFAAYRNRVLEGGPLGKKERALIQLTAAVAMRLSICVRKLTDAARRAGAKQAEIVQAMLIAGLQSGNSMLHTAYGGFAAECPCGNCHSKGGHAEK